MRRKSVYPVRWFSSNLPWKDALADVYFAALRPRTILDGRRAQTANTPPQFWRMGTFARLKMMPWFPANNGSNEASEHGGLLSAIFAVALFAEMPDR